MGDAARPASWGWRVAIVAGSLLAGAARAADEFLGSASCPGQARSPVAFGSDCS